MERYDEYGNLLEAKSETFYGHAWINQWFAGEVTSDPDHGYPLEYLRKEFTPIESTTDGEWNDSFRIKYSGWKDLASIEQVETTPDQSEGPTEYYLLDGRRVPENALTPGLYIMRRGDHTQKVLIK